eukprot:CAMPEP_0197439012 /NCGR_PEP_ID=MMETSP1175-20131217/5845_1 /TAXON_ID=1003142 /ORGANISM="Triceratium dubium, Strain CCMP147" /LENGTH=428 /DNA_ID=CAMNT_0042968833 /DNA_START=125 /DNA_END=1411 /DNA_ORIENTATION=+
MTLGDMFHGCDVFSGTEGAVSHLVGSYYPKDEANETEEEGSSSSSSSANENRDPHCHPAATKDAALRSEKREDASFSSAERRDQSDHSEAPEGGVLQLSDSDVEIQYRAPLGDGAFCNVYPVYLRGKSGKFEVEKPFALKRLRREVVGNANALKAASEDLTQEAQILAGLSHENIIKLHGQREGQMDTCLQEGSFFMVLDMLAETLDSRLKKWSKKRNRLTKYAASHETIIKRIHENALGIAKGMEYLHSGNIIFRDLKPANIGFDFAGRVKIFDFGLADKCGIDPSTGSCRAIGKVGTLRYMAPEVAKGKGTVYGLSADVFSFALLLWQIVTTRVPYEDEIPLSPLFEPKPIPENKRPSLKNVESKDLHALLEASWVSDPDSRLEFHDIVVKLNEIITQRPYATGKTKSPKKMSPKKLLLRQSVFQR